MDRDPATERFASEYAQQPRVPTDATAALRELTLVEDERGQAAVQRSRPDGLPAGIALLVVRHGPNAGARFLLDHDVTTTGRHPDSDIFLDDITVSRHHVEFRRSQATYQVVDLGSLNGTYVNQQRVDRATLNSGDEVQVGKFRLTFLTSTTG
jgi:pSer/pThr/pTyr-binding forkhead associated (FHA) protein